MKEYHVINILEGIYEDYVRDNDKEYMERNLALTEAVKALTEIQKYRAIGTVEECREARERQRDKKPIMHKDTNRADCPICGATVRGIKEPFGDWCSKCGQKLYWGETV